MQPVKRVADRNGFVATSMDEQQWTFRDHFSDMLAGQWMTYADLAAQGRTFFDGVRVHDECMKQVGHSHSGICNPAGSKMETLQGSVGRHAWRWSGEASSKGHWSLKTSVAHEGCDDD